MTDESLTADLLLAIDVGNTSIAIGLFNGDEKGHKYLRVK